MTSSSMLEGAIESASLYSPPITIPNNIIDSPNILSEKIIPQPKSSNLIRNILLLLLFGAIIYIAYHIYFHKEPSTFQDNSLLPEEPNISEITT